MRGQVQPPRRQRNDPQLKNLFEQIAQVEQQHLDAITQMEGGTVAAPADSATVPTTFTATYNNTETPQKQNDCYLCTDVLAMESTPRTCMTRACSSSAMPMRAACSTTFKSRSSTTARSSMTI